MKKFLLLAITVSVILSGCGASKQVTSNKSKNPDGQLLENNPCVEYAMLKPRVRAYGDGMHFKEATATNIAEMQARGKFARKIESAVLSATEAVGVDMSKYAGDQTSGQYVTDQSAETNDLVTSIASQLIRNTAIVKVARFFTDNNQYKIYVCLEFVDGEDAMMAQVEKAVKDKISPEDRAKIDARHDEFRNRIYSGMNAR